MSKRGVEMNFKEFFRDRDNLIKIGIIAGVVLLLALAIILIVTLSAGGKTEGFSQNYNTAANKKAVGENGDLAVALPAAQSDLDGQITAISLRGFVTLGGENYVLLLLNGEAFTLAVGDSVKDVEVKTVNPDDEAASLSVSGTTVALSFAERPSVTITR